MKKWGFCMGVAMMSCIGAAQPQDTLNDAGVALPARPAAGPAARDATDAEALRRGQAVAYGSPAVDPQTGEIYTRQIIEGHRLPVTAEQQRAAARRAPSPQVQPPTTAGEPELDLRALPAPASTRTPLERTSGMTLDVREAQAVTDGPGLQSDTYRQPDSDVDRFAPGVITGIALAAIGLLYLALRTLRKTNAGAEARARGDSMWGRKATAQDERAPGGPSSGDTSWAASDRGRSDLDDCYRILGLQPTATIDEVKAAYKRHAQQHHPDKVASLGKELRDLAAAKSAEINGAYEAIRAALEARPRPSRARMH